MALISPSEFTKLEEIDDEALRNSPSVLEPSAFKIRRAIFSSLLLVVAAGISGVLVAKFLEMSCGTASRPTILGLQVVGALILLWATLAVRGWDIQSISGVRLSERVNRWNYRFLYFAGTAILVCSVVWTSGRRGQEGRWASEIPMTIYEAVSSVLLLFTLIVLIVYTAKTATIARAAVEQAEAAQKPCLVPEIPPIGDWTPGAADEPLTADPDWQRVMLGPNLRNAGTGPALKIAFVGADDDRLAGKPCPYILPGETVDTANWRPMVGVVRVRITYQSVSGTKYETIVKFKDGKSIVDFRFGRYPLPR